MSRILLAAAVAVLPLGLAACGSTDKKFTGPNVHNVNVSITDAGCRPTPLTLPAGPTNFKVTATGSGKATEYELQDGGRILGERENLTPGLSGTFSLNLKPGRYVTYCPGAKSENGELIVTPAKGGAGSAGRNVRLDAATAAYASYVRAEVAQLRKRTKAFDDAVRAGNVPLAKSLFAPARAHYEAIEPVAESLGSYDPCIDNRVNDVKPGEQWTGFHRIEKTLWQQNTTKGMTFYANRLDHDIAGLQKKVAGLDYQPAALANGATDLLGEVSKSKITGEEDRYSHTDLSDFKANVDGAQKAFEVLKPVLKPRDAALAATLTTRFAVVAKALAPYEHNGKWETYTKLKKSEILVLSHTIDALAEPLSRVAAKVVA